MPNGIEAFLAPYRTDAMCCQYAIPGVVGVHPRVNKSALKALKRKGQEPMLNWVLVDVDNPKHRPWGGGLSRCARWVESQIASLPEPYASAACYYLTPHGYRIVLRLNEPFPVGQCEPRLRGFIDMLQRHGVAADGACKDWTRLFRLPRATVDGVRLNYPLDLR
jgi:hypothetical protein